MARLRRRRRGEISFNVSKSEERRASEEAAEQCIHSLLIRYKYAREGKEPRLHPATDTRLPRDARDARPESRTRDKQDKRDKRDKRDTGLGTQPDIALPATDKNRPS